MYIISGKYRGRKLSFPKNSGIRPTLNKIRTTIFDVLQFRVAPGAIVLDCFAGSGILGIEALSRWASYAVFFERNRDLVNILNANLLNLGLMLHGKVLCLNAMKPRTAQMPCHVIFIDPPYESSNIIPDLVRKLTRKGWAAQGTILVIETSKYSKVVLPKSYQIFARKIRGNIKLEFYSCDLTDDDLYEENIPSDNAGESVISTDPLSLAYL